MKHHILAYYDHQNSVTCMMGCIFTIIILYSIAFHACKRAQRYPMVDFLTGHRLGTDISSEHRLTGQVLFPNSKNSSIMYETLSNLLWRIISQKWRIRHTHSIMCRTHPLLRNCRDNAKLACHCTARYKIEWIYIKTKVSSRDSLEVALEMRKKERKKKD